MEPTKESEMINNRSNMSVLNRDITCLEYAIKMLQQNRPEYSRIDSANWLWHDRQIRQLQSLRRRLKREKEFQMTS